MAGGYIPQADSEFDTFQINFADYVNANMAGLGLGLGELDALNAARTAWEASYPAHVTAQAAAQAARQTKQTDRETYETEIRNLVNILQASPDVDDTERQAMGITVRDTTRTPVAAPTSRPVLQSDTSQRLRVGVSFVDELTPTSRAKPDGVMGCEIYMKIGDPAPTDLDDMVFVTLDTRTPHTIDFDGADANKPVHFIGRWVSTRSEPGPISETVSATVVG
ncbi:MAG: hypothetical protein IH851_00085 [Armatimonadetes bacterium]|nr:hypothetical protein [Armatimonadota bacterium]